MSSSDSAAQEIADQVCERVHRIRISHSGPYEGSKYLQQTSKHVAEAVRMAKYFKSASSVFEIGPGPGFLLAVLKAQGKAISGCDSHNTPDHLFHQMRAALGVQPFVIEHKVLAYRPIPITPGAEGLAAITTGIDRDWGVSEHEWFLAECAAKLSGQKRLVFGFQLPVATAPVQKFYRDRSLFQKGSICVVDL